MERNALYTTSATYRHSLQLVEQLSQIYHQVTNTEGQLLSKTAQPQNRQQKIRRDFN
jgi:hypothetical protein